MDYRGVDQKQGTPLTKRGPIYECLGVEAHTSVPLTTLEHWNFLSSSSCPSVSLNFWFLSFFLLSQNIAHVFISSYLIAFILQIRPESPSGRSIHLDMYSFKTTGTVPYILS